MDTSPEEKEISFQFPHCDARILHAPQDGCVYCNHHPDWQELRKWWGIAFTGHKPSKGQVPCPADVARPQGSDSDYRAWGGNNIQRPEDPVIGMDYAGYPLTAQDPRLAEPRSFSRRIRRRLGLR